MLYVIRILHFISCKNTNWLLKLIDYIFCSVLYYMILRNIGVIPSCCPGPSGFSKIKDPLASASRVSGNASMCHHFQLIFFCFKNSKQKILSKRTLMSTCTSLWTVDSHSLHMHNSCLCALVKFALSSIRKGVACLWEWHSLPAHSPA